LNEKEKELYSKLIETLFFSLKPLKDIENPIAYLEKYILKESEELEIDKEVKNSFNKLRYYLIRDVIGYGILDVPMNDENIEEITCERFDRSIGVVHREYTQFNILDTNIVFGGLDTMNGYVQRIMQRAGKSVTAAVPIMDAVTKDGDRIMVTYSNEVSLPGPTISIRKFPRQPYVITHLLNFNTLNKLMAAYIWLLIDVKAFGLIVGETGSGKTTLINSLLCLSNPRWKVITIEETPELKIPHYRWQRLVTRSSASIAEEKFEIDIMDLVKASMRMRPDFLIVGEVRGIEAHMLFQSAATGHGGLTSFHASDPLAALNRLSAEPINVKTSQQMLLWFIIHVTKIRLPNGRIVRRVTNISEVLPKEEKVEINEIFKYNIREDRFNIEEDEIDILVNKCKRAKQAAELLNVDLEEDLKRRMYFIDKCQKKQANTVDDVFDIIEEYYTLTSGTNAGR
ncbi:MAG: type II secretion system protein E, partial [Candidatus Nitrosothermus koennekii]